MESHLRHEPTKVSRNRIKRLREMAHPEYRLRLDECRVFYGVEADSVIVLAIIPKTDTEVWLRKHGEKTQ